MSSITAAPRIACAKGFELTFISSNTATVIPTDVAVSAAPRKSE